MLLGPNRAVVVESIITVAFAAFAMKVAEWGLPVGFGWVMVGDPTAPKHSPVLGAALAAAIVGAMLIPPATRGPWVKNVVLRLLRSFALALIAMFLTSRVPMFSPREMWAGIIGISWISFVGTFTSRAVRQTLTRAVRRGRRPGSGVVPDFATRMPRVYWELFDARCEPPRAADVAAAMGISERTFHEYKQRHGLPWPPNRPA
ncbi:MAG: hypothetical protein HY691_12820 [Chloroflexi bacterium]|nr:hypothetical protein [Chloroflexota bacterium]